MWNNDPDADVHGYGNNDADLANASKRRWINLGFPVRLHCEQQHAPFRTMEFGKRTCIIKLFKIRSTYITRPLE